MAAVRGCACGGRCRWSRRGWRWTRSGCRVRPGRGSGPGAAWRRGRPARPRPRRAGWGRGRGRGSRRWPPIRPGQHRGLAVTAQVPTSRSGTTPPLDNRAQATRNRYDSMLGQAPGRRSCPGHARPGRDRDRSGRSMRDRQPLPGRRHRTSGRNLKREWLIPQLRSPRPPTRRERRANTRPGPALEVKSAGQDRYCGGL